MPHDLNQLETALARSPRVALLEGPTPIQKLSRLSRAAELHGCNLCVKRDDLMGLGGGGNKLRKLEFLLGEALAEGADTLVTWGGFQSNHARLTAAVAALVPHFVSLTEQLPATHTEDDLEQFTVAGFSFSIRNGITLNGSRTLKNGSTLTLTAPFVSFDEEQFEEYDGAPELEEAAAAVLAEVELALRGKCSDAGKQLALFETERVEELNDIK